MQTASGQALEDSSDRNTGNSRKSKGRRGLSPMVWAITVLLLALSLVVMGVYLLGWWPPEPAEESLTVAEQWNLSHTSTPSIQYANGLTVEKVGTPRNEGSTVTVTLKVINNVMMPDPTQPTPEPGKPPADLVPAKVYSGSIRVLFYNEVDGKQVVTGGGYGNVVNLEPGQSQTIDVVSTPVEDYSEATGYEAFPDYVWTDKDPIKATPESGTEPGGSPVPAEPTP